LDAHLSLLHEIRRSRDSRQRELVSVAAGARAACSTWDHSSRRRPSRSARSRHRLFEKVLAGDERVAASLDERRHPDDDDSLQAVVTSEGSQDRSRSGRQAAEELDKSIGLIGKLIATLKTQPDLAAQKLGQAQFLSLGIDEGALAKSRGGGRRAVRRARECGHHGRDLRRRMRRC
jgi:hypothetical protein